MITPLWNVRGVDEETRRKAKAAAAWTGMTIGEWLDRAVGVMAEDDLHTKLPKIAGGEVESEKVPGVTRIIDAVPDKPKKGRPAKAKGEKKKAAKCAHGVGKGINCWQCGGLAKIEA